MISTLFSEMSTLRNGMDATWLRQEVILDNIANVDTPNFKRSAVAFEGAFSRALREHENIPLKQTRNGHRDFGQNANNVRGTVIQDRNTTVRMDGNNVDMDVETTELARNTIYYQTLQAQMNSEFNQIRMAIREGR